MVTTAPDGATLMWADQGPEGSRPRTTDTRTVVDSPGRSTPLVWLNDSHEAPRRHRPADRRTPARRQPDERRTAGGLGVDGQPPGALGVVAGSAAALALAGRTALPLTGVGVLAVMRLPVAVVTA